MKYGLLLALGLALGGCVTSGDRMALDDSKCTSYGLVKGTQAYADCRMQLENNRAGIAASERFAQGGGLMGAIKRSSE